MLNWEVALVILVLIILGSGIVRLAMKRQMEILKDYLLPKDTPLKRTILRPGKDQSVNRNAQEQAETHLQNHSTERQHTQNPEQNGNSQTAQQTVEMTQPSTEQSNAPLNVS